MFRILRRCLIGLVVATPLLFAGPAIEKASAQSWDYYPSYRTAPYYYNYNYRPYRNQWNSPVYTYPNGAVVTPNGTVVTPYRTYYNPYSAYYYWW